MFRTVFDCDDSCDKGASQMLRLDTTPARALGFGGASRFRALFAGFARSYMPKPAAWIKSQAQKKTSVDVFF